MGHGGDGIGNGAGGGGTRTPPPEPFSFCPPLWARTRPADVVWSKSSARVLMDLSCVCQTVLAIHLHTTRPPGLDAEGGHRSPRAEA